jgi:hypothetical protein
MGSPPEKGGKKNKKSPGINPGQPTGKGWKKKYRGKTPWAVRRKKAVKKTKKNPGINLGQPLKKGEKKIIQRPVLP